MSKKLFQANLTNRKIFLLLVDSALLAAAVYLSLFLSFDTGIPRACWDDFIWYLIIIIPAVIVSLHLLKAYQISLKYIGLPDVFNLLKANIYGFFAAGVLALLLKHMHLYKIFPRTIIFVGFFIAFLFTAGFRLIPRILGIFTKKTVLGGDRTLIVGAGDAGEQILRNIIEARNTGYIPVGFIDDNHYKKGLTIHGITVMGTHEQIPDIARRFGIQAVLIAIPSAGVVIIKGIVEHCRKAGIKKIKVLPRLSELISGRVGLKDVREIHLEELLQRQEISINLSNLLKSFKDKVILVTGAAGSIGSELCLKLAGFSPQKLIILDQDETRVFELHNDLLNRFSAIEIVPVVADVRDGNKIERIFSVYSPEIVFHAAAYKHVPIMEIYPEEAVLTNVVGTWVVAQAAFKHKVQDFVLISTDKAVNPISVMGATKRAAEMIISCYRAKSGQGIFSAVRFGNVLESRGNVFTIFNQQIKEKRAITITHPDMERYLISLSEAVLLVLEASTLKQGDIYMLDMGKPVKIVDIVNEMIRLYQYEPDKDIPVVFIGKRPGEKVKEECLMLKENIIETLYNKIFVVQSSLLLKEEGLFSLIEELEAAAKDSNRDKIIELLKKLIPEYCPSR